MSTSIEPRERIEEVASRIVALRDAYYRGDPLVADADYDALEGELRALIAAHPELAPDPNPLESVGAPASQRRWNAGRAQAARPPRTTGAPGPNTSGSGATSRATKRVPA